MPHHSDPQIPAVPVVKSSRSSRRGSLELIGILEEEREQASQLGKLGYLVSGLVQLHLPLRESLSRTFVRRHANAVLTLAPISADYPLPFGRYPRLVMIDVCTRAILRRDPQVSLGSNYYDYLRSLGLSAGGKAVRDVQEQLKRLSATSLRVEYTSEDRVNWRNSAFFPEGELWWSEGTASQIRRQDSWVRLAPDLYEDLVANRRAVPVNWHIIRQLRTALEIDMAVWLPWRVHLVTRGVVQIPWSGLMAQFGTEFTSQKEFTRSLKAAISRVLAFFPRPMADAIDLGQRGRLLIRPARGRLSE